MQMTDILAQMGGLQSVARELGMRPDEAASGADALLPAMAQNAAAQSGLAPSLLKKMRMAGKALR